MSKINYRPEIDGLRAIAVLPVILFHLGVPWMSGGFVGVDVFFVISGFLITSILIKDLETGTFTLRAFWLRRIRRLVPALATMLLCTLAAGRLLLLASELKNLGRQGAASMLSWANLFFWQAAGNYWGPQAHEQPLLHMWSLSVEEQFYLLYPVSLYLIHRLARRQLQPLLCAATLSSLALCLYLSHRHPPAAFYLLPSRAWELGFGCVLAIHRSKSPSRWQSWRFGPLLFLAGIAGIAASCLLINGAHTYPGYATLLPVVSAAAIIAFGEQLPPAPGFLLSNPVIVYLGKASYSLYLWHWPVIVLVAAARTISPAVVPLPAVAALVFALGLLSYHLVERIGRTERLWIPYVSAAVGSVLAVSAFDYFGTHRYDLGGFAPVEWNGRKYDTIPVQKPWAGVVDEGTVGLVAPLREHLTSDAYKTGGIIKRYGPPVPQVVVIGDSHALMWSSIVDAICKEQRLTVSFYGADGTPAVFSPQPERRATTHFTADQKYDFDAARLRFLQEWKPRLILLLVRWDVWELNEARLTEFVSMLGKLGTRMVVVSQPPVMFYGGRNALHIAAELRARGSLQPTLPIGSPDEWRAGNALAATVVKKLSNAELVEVTDLYLRGDDRGRFIDGDRILYADNDHLSEYGASLASDRLRAAVLRAMDASSASPRDEAPGPVH